MRRLLLILLAASLTLAVASSASAAPRVGIGPAVSLGGKARPVSKPRPKDPTAGVEAAVAAALFADSFDRPDGLITNEYATWNPNSSAAVKSADWQMTSGSLFAKGGAGWTGVPDGCSSASASGSPCTASAVFRLNSARRDFGDITVSTALRVQRLVSTSRASAVAWDGVHVWLRYQSEESLCCASFARRDGRIVVKKKCPGGSENGGTILTATDKGLGCAPITAPGAVGIRGDNADFSFDDFVVPPG